MQNTKFEKLDVQVSRLGFGLMRLPCSPDGTVDKAATFDMVDYAYNHGITYYDTAYAYHKGQSEVALGEALKRYPRESLSLATKLPVWLVNNEEEMEKVFNTQLERLQTEYFDFYLLHAMNLERLDLIKKNGAYAFLKKKQAEGKIKYIGCSFHDKTEVFSEIVDAYPWDFVQIQFNYIDTKIIDAMELYDVLTKRDIPVIVMEPIRGGVLAELPAPAEALFKAQKPDRSMTDWALRWVASFKNVKVILSGMSNMAQMQENIATFDGDLTLTADDLAVYDKVIEEILNVKTIGCTACGYCMPCPHGVAIPNVFTIYNSLKMFRNLWRTHEEYYNYFEPSKRGEHCIACGECLSKCPQQLAIPELLKMADAELYEAKIAAEAAR